MSLVLVMGGDVNGLMLCGKRWRHCGGSVPIYRLANHWLAGQPMRLLLGGQSMRVLGAIAALVMLTGASPGRVSMEAAILPPAPVTGDALKPFVRSLGARVALAHVRVIHGTGAPALPDRTLLVDNGRIAGILAAGEQVPAGYALVNLAGRSVIPGIVGMHDHLYYISRPDLDSAGHSEAPTPLLPQMTFSSARMYLAGGVTTLRTTGSVEPYTDLNLKRQIDAGKLPGPHIDVTAPYLEGAGSPFIQMHQLTGPDDARRTVDFWADQGATSFKAYMNITRAELAAAIEAAHSRGLKLTGHLCSVTYREAAMLGIDDLEHGFWANTQFDPGKAPDTCSKDAGFATLAGMAPDGAEAKSLIRLLVERRVALTSTLAVFESLSPSYRTLPPRQLEMLSPEARLAYTYLRLRNVQHSPERKANDAKMWANDLALERAFVAAGGLLIGGPDPTGAGQVLPGFGNQRAIELLVEAGFTPLEAIRIGTLNGATFLGLAHRIGSIAVGKNADVVIVKGDPSINIGDIEKVELVMKDGVAFDPDALLEDVKGHYGEY